jgi:hypothetical protein
MLQTCEYLSVNIMATITFDTLKFVERLKAGGVPEARAKAKPEALVTAGGMGHALRCDA